MSTTRGRAGIFTRLGLDVAVELGAGGGFTFSRDHVL